MSHWEHLGWNPAVPESDPSIIFHLQSTSFLPWPKAPGCHQPHQTLLPIPSLKGSTPEHSLSCHQERMGYLSYLLPATWTSSLQLGARDLPRGLA